MRLLRASEEGIDDHNSVDEHDEETGFLKHDTEGCQPHINHPTLDNVRSARSRRSNLPWIMSTITLATLLSLVAILQSRTTNKCSWVFPTDLKDARKAIQYEQRTYSGELIYNRETKALQRVLNAETQYFGYPSADTEAAWANLMRGQYPVMTPEEAAPFEPELRRIPKDGNFHFEPDLFHNLHCINNIRLELSKYIYPDLDPAMLKSHSGFSKLPIEWQQVHLEHCLEQLMQAIMCHGDLTPTPLYTWKGVPLGLGRPGAHTCRKFEPIREWMDERNVNGSAFEGL